jgi:pimeloyl-ACP methyl ester carboxylesterase
VPGGYEQALGDIDVTFGIEGPAIGEWQAGAFDAGAIAQPVLFISGGDSVIVPPQLADAFTAKLGDPETRVIPGTDHALVVQKPDEIAQAIADFIGRHPL